MKAAAGLNGVEVHEVWSTDRETLDQIVVELDSKTRAIVDYVENLKNGSNHWNGYELGANIAHIMEDITSIKSQLSEYDYYKENNPAVRAAWEHYQMMLILAKEDNK
jgi:hypothetical protein